MDAVVYCPLTPLPLRPETFRREEIFNSFIAPFPLPLPYLTLPSSLPPPPALPQQKRRESDDLFSLLADKDTCPFDRVFASPVGKQRFFF